jgi:tetratricopeptide (TPR) repeat protein
MVWNNQGVYYEFTGEKAKADDAYSHALALLEQQVQMKPNDSTVQADLALRYLKQHHDTAKALTHIKTALALQPTNGKEPKDGRVLQIAGEVYYGLGDRQMGMKYIVESLKYGRTLEGFNLDPDMREMMSDPKTRGVFETAQARLRRSTKGAGT